MELEEDSIFTEAEKEYIASLLVDYKRHYSKSVFRRLASKVINPNKIVKEIDYSEVKEEYLERMFSNLNNYEFLSFVCRFVEETKPNERTQELFNVETDKLEQITTQAALDHDKFITELNKVTSLHNISITYEGELKGLTEMTLKKGFDTYVFDLLEKFNLHDIKELLKKSHDFSHSDDTSSESVYNSGRAVEGVLKKTLISICNYDSSDEIEKDLRKEIGKLMRKLANKNFWTEDNPIYKVTNDFRELFRNVSSHYSTQNTSFELKKFDKSEASFAYYLSVTIISYLLERLNDTVGTEMNR